LEGALRDAGLEEPIELTRDRVSLAPAVQWAIDVARYAILSRDPAQAQRAAALYREPVFPGLDDEVLERERRRLRATQMELLTRLLQTGIGRGDPMAIDAAAGAILRLDPLCEQTIAKAVAALNALGEADRARRLYERLAQAMREELDDEPAPFGADDSTTEEAMRHVLRPLVDKSDALRGANAQLHFARVETQLDTIRRALDAAIVRRYDVELGVRALAALSRFLFDRGHAVEAFGWYEAAIPHLAPDSALAAEAIYLRALVGRNLGNAEQNLPAFEHAIDVLRAAGEQITLAKAMLYGSNAARMTGRVQLAQELASEALQTLQEHDDAYLVAFARSALGAAAYASGRLDLARREFESAGAGFAALGAGDDEALMLVNAGRCAFAQGDLPVADEHVTRALRCAVGSGNRYVEGHAEVGLTLLALDRNDLRAGCEHAARAAEIASGSSDMELSVIALESAAELFLALGEFGRARDALAAADGVRSEYLIARAPTEHARCERVRTDLARRALSNQAPVAAPDIMMRSLLTSVARSYRKHHIL
jgi:tetratricopeptide (TPR) repeat protein